MAVTHYTIMGSRKKSGSRNNIYLRTKTIPNKCTSPSCEEELTIEDTLQKTEKGTAFRARCPGCSSIFDQACPKCGCKEIQNKQGVEECVKCGLILTYGNDTEG